MSSHIFDKEDYFEGQKDLRIEIADYLVSLAELPIKEEVSDLPRFLKVLANRIRCGEVP